MSGSRRPVGIRVSAEGADLARAELEKLGAVGAAAFGRVADASGRASAPVVALAGNTQQAARQMQAFAQQMPDVVSGILTGQSAFQLLVQQGGQIVSVTGSMGAAMRGLVAFMGGPYVAAALAAGAALGALAARSASLSGEQRQLDVALRGVGRTAEVSAGQLVAYTRALEKQGVAREEARKIAADLARTQGLSGTNAGRVTALAPDLGAALGIDAAAAAKQLADAFSGGYGAVTKLDDALNVLTADQHKAIRAMLEHGEKAKAAEVIFEALHNRLAGLHRDSLSPMGRALEDLSKGWDGFINSVANSSAMIALVQTLGLAVQGMAAVAGAGGGTDAQIAKLEGQLKNYEEGARVFGADSAPGQRAAELRQQIANLRAMRMVEGGPVTGGAAAAPDRPAAPGVTANEAERQRKMVDDMTLSLAEQQRIMAASLPTRARVRAEILAEKEARDKGFDADAAAELKKRRVAEATLTAGDAAVQAAAAISREGQAALALVAASEQGRAAMLAARAAAEAHEQAATEAGVAESALTAAILNRNAAQEAAKGADIVVGLREQIAATQALTAAEAAGPRAAYWAILDQKIADATKEMRAHRDAATDPAIKAALDRQITQVEKLTREQEKQNQVLALKRDITADKQSIELMQREIELVGESASVRERELTTLKAIQAIEGRGGDRNNLKPEERDYIASKQRVAEVNSELRRQQTLYEEIANSASRAFETVGDAITQAFVNGNGAAVNWGNVTRGVISAVIQQALKLSVINPVLNSMLGGDRASVWSAAGGGGIAGGLNNLSSFAGLGNLFGGGGSVSNFLVGAPGVAGGSFADLGGITWGGSAATSGLLGSGGNLFGMQGLGLGGIGSSLGMIGAGIGVGNLLGGLVAKSEAQRQNAMYGSLIGTLLGGPIGGGLGGLIGGFVGPKDSVKGWSYAIRGDGEGLGAGVGGQIKMTDVFYNESGKAQFDAANQSIAALNAFLAEQGLTVQGARAVGGNKNGPDASWGGAASFGDALADLRFGSSKDTRLDSYLSGKAFDDPAKLAEAVQGFTAAAAAIDALGAEAIPAFTASLKAVNDNFDAGIEQARKYGLAEANLTTARAEAIAALEAQRTETLRQSDVSLAIRRLAATGSTQDAELARQAEAARQEIEAFGRSLDALAINAEDKALRLIALEEVQAAERAAIIERYGEQAAQALRQAGGNIRAWLDNLATGTTAGASPTDRLAAAQAAFDRDRTLSLGGDRDALGRITGSADALLSAGRDNYASGAGFQSILASVRGGLSSLPVVQSYDAMMAGSLAAIQQAITAGTLNTAIVPGGNLVQISGALQLAGVEAALAAIDGELAAGHGMVSANLGAANAHLYAANEIAVAQHASIVAAHASLVALHATQVAMHQSIVALHQTAVAVEGGIYGAASLLGTQLAAVNDNLVAGNTIGVDGAVALYAAIGAGNQIAADASAAVMTALGLANSIASTASGHALASAGRLAIANNTAQAANNYHIANGQRIDAANKIAADAAAAIVASLSALNTIGVDAAAANTNSIAAMNTILVDASAAIVTALGVGNSIASTASGHALASAGRLAISNNTLEAANNYHIANGQRIDAANKIAADAAAAIFAGLGAMNTINVDASAALTASLAAMNTILVDSSAASTNSLALANTIAAQIRADTGAIRAYSSIGNNTFEAANNYAIEQTNELRGLRQQVNELKAALVTLTATVQQAGILTATEVRAGAAGTIDGLQQVKSAVRNAA